jgi:hypothetical protein
MIYDAVVSALSNGDVVAKELVMGKEQQSLCRFLMESSMTGDIEMCRLAKEWGATNWNGMLKCAALGGHEHLCRLAKEWGATKWNWMMSGAAEGGHEHLCRLAKEWGREAIECGSRGSS